MPPKLTHEEDYSMPQVATTTPRPRRFKSRTSEVPNPDTLKQGDIIINKQSIIVLTGHRNASGTILEAEVFSRKGGTARGIRSYGFDALYAGLDAGWVLYRAEALPSAPVPPTALPPVSETLCEACAGLGVSDYAACPDGSLEPVDCPQCGGQGSRLLCEGCGQTPSFDTDLCGCNQPCEICKGPGPVDSANVCQACFKQGLEALEREAEEHDRLVHEEVAWALSVGLCRPEQVGL